MAHLSTVHICGEGNSPSKGTPQTPTIRTLLTIFIFINLRNGTGLG